MVENKTPPSTERLPLRLKRVRQVSLISFLALIIWLLAGNLWSYFHVQDGSNRLIMVMLVIQLIPLAIIAPGLIKGTPRGHIWSCFVVTLYFIQGVLETFDPARRWFGCVEILLTVILFISALLYARWRSQYERQLSDRE